MELRIDMYSIRQVVLTGIYSTFDNEDKHEGRARTIVQRELGSSVNVVCSKEGASSLPSPPSSLVLLSLLGLFFSWFLLNNLSTSFTT